MILRVRFSCVAVLLLILNIDYGFNQSVSCLCAPQCRKSSPIPRPSGPPAGTARASWNGCYRQEGLLPYFAVETVLVLQNQVSFFAQVYIFGGRIVQATISRSGNQSDVLQHSHIDNHFFAFDTLKEVWERLPDGPLGTMLYDFVFLSVGRSIFLHGGETPDGVTKATLWRVRLFSDAGLRPLWSMMGAEGIGARKQHCAAELNDTVFFWGGKSGDVDD
jgi:hypothetical protein